MNAVYFPLPPIIEPHVIFGSNRAATFCQPATEVRREKTPLTVVKVSPRYVDPEIVGEGGTAVVYQMTDTRLGRSVAFKRFKKGAELETKTDYLAELTAVSRIGHPNVVNTFDAGEDAEGRYIIMELIDGRDAEEFVQEMPLDLIRFIDFSNQCLEGLLAIHEGGLLHLDLKPSNVMVSPQMSGRNLVKIVDFGRAQFIEDEAGQAPQGRGMNGSIFFAAPEQLLSQSLDVRADLYAMGCVFYWCLTGKRPFDGADTLSVVASHLQNSVTPLSQVASHLPQGLCDWVMSFLALNRESRPASARVALQQLADLTYTF